MEPKPDILECCEDYVLGEHSPYERKQWCGIRDQRWGWSWRWECNGSQHPDAPRKALSRNLRTPEFNALANSHKACRRLREENRMLREILRVLKAMANEDRGGILSRDNEDESDKTYRCDQDFECLPRKHLASLRVSITNAHICPPQDSYPMIALTSPAAWQTPYCIR
ncbi:uncharacterized protein F5147DRAFT_816248 [Suillus discolor]|uniref:Uncharacterized protein n=1 Tax=Suillus discolor TaxID=1912936 RepID=A0A9P7EZN9_9AGAM|nr:uncharacterized protein F5147DRAFT_816248 [Suillus discolor]KAG2097980.1 hypothetical protein F5147DRAFT_816248 [Suillus discolor]